LLAFSEEKVGKNFFRLIVTAGDKLNLASTSMQDFHLLLFPFSQFQDVDFFAWSHFNENYANNLTASIQ
jgi:hypothetical protein